MRVTRLGLANDGNGEIDTPDYAAGIGLDQTLESRRARRFGHTMFALAELCAIEDHLLCSIEKPSYDPSVARHSL